MGKSNLVQVLHKWESAWAYYVRIILVERNAKLSNTFKGIVQV
jgi:hypothetical protein